jgi:uncharacterized protein (TIGR00255 family)
MTGYGRREASWQRGSVTVEVRTVNHRFLEVVIRLPRPLSDLEEPFKKAVQRRCLRGRVEVTVSLGGEKGGARAVSLDRSLARQYHQALRELQKELRIGGTIDIALLSGFRDIVVVADAPGDSSQLGRLAQRLLDLALGDADRMRRREGAALAKEIRDRLRSIRKAKRQIAGRAPEVAREAFARMKARVEQLLGAEPPDVGRLNQELAIYADRYDITEELVRLDSHMVQFAHALRREGSVGKTLDFLLQEMGREVNTIGSKAADAEIASQVVHIKAELEKIREQVQNVE